MAEQNVEQARKDLGFVLLEVSGFSAARIRTEVDALIAAAKAEAIRDLLTGVEPKFFPLISAGNLESIAYELEQTGATKITPQSQAVFYRHLATQLRALNALNALEGK